MRFEEGIVALVRGRGGPEKRVVVREHGEEDTEEEGGGAEDQESRKGRRSSCGGQVVGGGGGGGAPGLVGVGVGISGRLARGEVGEGVEHVGRGFKLIVYAV